MVAIKRIQIKAYILFESLVSLALLAGIVSLLITSVQASRQASQDEIVQQEILALSRTALQTQQTELSLNGHTVTVQRDDQHIRIHHQGKELLHVHKD